MAPSRKPGPQCPSHCPIDIRDGMSPCAAFPPPGLIGCVGGTVWHCGARNCPTHPHPEDRCRARVWPFRPRLPGPDRGSETIRRLGIRKQAILSYDGNVFDVAVAMLETRKMKATYPFGDRYPDGRPKQGDAANFGIFKQNWLMIRSSWPPYTHLGPDDYRTGRALNDDLNLDIQVLHASQARYGVNDLWFSGHRNGATGLDHPNTLDIDRYRRAIAWIRDQLSSDAVFLSDDTRFWVHVDRI